MMFKSVKKLYELHRSYDFGELNKKFVKHRAHKRLRQQLKPTKERPKNENME